jgi:Brix domain
MSWHQDCLDSLLKPWSRLTRNHPLVLRPGSSYNRIKDFAAVAGHLGVTHILTVSQTKSNIILRIARTPSGPTLHFKISSYSLARQVRILQKRPYESAAACKGGGSADNRC